MLKKANLFLNGSNTIYKRLLDSSSYTLCADGGVKNALANGLNPNAILGDGDSVQTLIDAGVYVKGTIPFIEAADQDHTDFEKALTYLHDNHYREIHVYCFDGDRLDHMLAGLSAVSAMPKLSITLYTASQIIQLLPKHYKMSCHPNEIVSLIPFQFAGNVSTNGLKWDLDGHNMELGSFLSISNVTVGSEVTIRFSTGYLFLIYTPAAGL